MTSVRLCLSVLLVSLTAGCVVPIAEPVYSTCRGTSAGAWSASIERVPRWRGGKPKKLIIVVNGRMNVPESVDVRLELGPIEKLDRRVQQVLVRTEGSAAPDAPLVARSVSGRLAPNQRFDSVRIRCGDGNFALIPNPPEVTPAAS